MLSRQILGSGQELFNTYLDIYRIIKVKVGALLVALLSNKLNPHKELLHTKLLCSVLSLTKKEFQNNSDIWSDFETWIWTKIFHCLLSNKGWGLWVTEEWNYRSIVIAEIMVILWRERKPFVIRQIFLVDLIQRWL